MLAIFIHSLEVALLALMSFLTYRVHQLYVEEGYSVNNRARYEGSTTQLLDKLISASTAKNSLYETKMDCLKKAQTFSGMQLMLIKRSYGNLQKEDLSWLREAISLYVIGATDLICKEAKCSVSVRKEITTLVLKSNLNLRDEASLTYYREALYRTLSSDNDLMVRAGAKAAKYWLNKGNVPSEMTLTAQLDEWGIFA